MFYLGIDIGKFHHATALLTPRRKGRCYTLLLPQYTRWLSGTTDTHNMLSTCRRGTPVSALEATGPYWNWIPLAKMVEDKRLATGRP